MNDKDKKILIYDDTCDVCTLARDAVEKRDKNNLFELVGAHSEQGKLLRQKYNLDTEKSAYVIENGATREKSDMAFHVLEQLGWFEKLVARIGRLVPKKAADFFYSLFAKHRKVFNRD